MAFVVARPSEILVITGYRIKDVKLARKAWVWPGQHCSRVKTSPVNYSVEVQAMSSEKLRFLLPAVFTIGPRLDDNESLLRYAKVMPLASKNFAKHLEDLVLGIVMGETRVVAASMTMEEIFKGTKEFKREVFEKVQLELNQFGLHIYNANVKQLRDIEGCNYFYNLGRKIQMEAASDVAETETKGRILSKAREARVLQNAAKLDSETKIAEERMKFESSKAAMKMASEKEVLQNEMDAAVAESAWLLESRRAVSQGRADKARLEAEKAMAIREAELDVELESKAAMVKGERARAQAAVDSAARAQEADSRYYQQQKKADAQRYAEEKEAEAKKLAADAEMYANQRKADADLYRKMREAESLVALSDAQAHHIQVLLDALGGNYGALRDYIMLQNGLYREVARSLGGGLPHDSAVKQACLMRRAAGAPTQMLVGYGGSGGNIPDGSLSSVNDVLNVAMETMVGTYKMTAPVVEEHVQDNKGEEVKPAVVVPESDSDARSTTSSN
ncbi:Flotillin-like protein 1 [Nymphaea thermarum]|nr:Flotillin-like protein 1 [Nymphaea thermarum]